MNSTAEPPDSFGGRQHAYRKVELAPSTVPFVSTMSENSPKSKTILTAEAFDACVKRTRMSPTTRAAAYRVLVEGTPNGEVAKDAGVSPGRVSQVVSQIVGIYEASIQPALDSRVQIIQADYAEAVRQVREASGDSVSIGPAQPEAKYSGKVLVRSDYHLMQEASARQVVAHKISDLDVVPAVGGKARISYTKGRATVTGMEKEAQGKGR